MIVEARTDDFRALIAGDPPRDFTLPDSEVAAPDVLEMLHALAETIRPVFDPAAWLIVEDGEVVGLCSIVRAPGSDGVVEIGYGVAPTRRRRGAAGRAVADVVAWAQADSRVLALAAETAPSNTSSQRTLALNGFRRVGEREDAEDGRLLCWRIETGL